MLKKLIPPILLLILSVSTLLTVGNTNALQTASISLNIVPSGSWLAAKLTETPGSYVYAESLSPTQTLVTSENTGRWYGWSFDPNTSKPCAQATAQSVKIRARNDATVEGSPDWSVMVLVSIDNDAETVEPLTPERPVIEGYSPDQIPLYVGRWSSDIFNYPNTEEGMGTGIEGPMEAIWNIESLQPGEELTLGVGHDAEDGTTGLQTTIESVEVTYDTTQCASTDPSAPTTPATTIPPTSPKSGLVVNLIVWSSILISSLVLLFVAAKRLKKAH